MGRTKRKLPVELHSIGRHHPIYARGGRPCPSRMAQIKMDEDQARTLHDIANSIFTDCCNAGMPFQSALVAIYLSGLENGSAASSERKDNA